MVVVSGIVVTGLSVVVVIGTVVFVSVWIPLVVKASSGTIDHP